MTAVGQDFTMRQGDSKLIHITVVDEYANLLDISGVDVSWIMYKRNPDNPTLQKTTVSGITLTVPVSGILTIRLLPSDTASLLGRFYHECEITDISGNISTVTEGCVTIFKSKA
jgi:hypothetical protein